MIKCYRGISKGWEDDIKTKFRTWFNKQWAQWDAENGRRTTQQELADYLGISRSSVAQYVNGKQVPEGENLAHIAARWPGVYEVVEDPFSGFSEPLASKLRSVSREIEEMLNRGDFPPNSPEHAAAVREASARYGIELQDIEIKDD